MDRMVGKLGIALAVGLTVVLWGTMIGLTGILDIDWLKVGNVLAAADIIASPFTIGFVLLFPLTFGLVSALTFKFERIDVYLSAIPGAILGIIVFLVMFGWDIKTIVFAICTIPALVAVIETSYFRKDEFKKLATLRTGSESAKKGFLVFTIGLFLVYAAIGSANNNAYVDEFFEIVNTKVTGQMLGGSDFSQALAEQQLNVQKIVFVQMMNSENFKRLRQKADPDVVAFVEWTELSIENLDDPATKEKVANQIRDNDALSKVSINADFFRQKFPEGAAAFDFYWLIATLGVITAFTFYTNIIGSLLAGIYTSAIKSMLDTLKSGEKPKEQGKEIPQPVVPAEKSLKEKLLNMK